MVNNPVVGLRSAYCLVGPDFRSRVFAIPSFDSVAFLLYRTTSLIVLQGTLLSVGSFRCRGSSLRHGIRTRPIGMYYSVRDRRRSLALVILLHFMALG